MTGSGLEGVPLADERRHPLQVRAVHAVCSSATSTNRHRALTRRICWRYGDTRPEVALRSLLHKRGLRFRKDQPLHLPHTRVRPDVVFPSARVAIFLDGCYWHGCTEHKTLPKTNVEFWAKKISRNVERDREVDQALAESGWLVLRFWEHDDLTDACDAIEHAVRRRHT